MSYYLLEEDTLFRQRLLKSSGFYTGKLDGIWGKQTTDADNSFRLYSTMIGDKYGIFDERTEACILSLMPQAQIEARRFVKLARDYTKGVTIISGTRTYKEQDALYAQGRTEPGRIVTHAIGGYSNHNFGIAWDIGLFHDDVYIEGDTYYISLARMVLPKVPNVEWGGNWQSFKDFPHYQLKAVSDKVALIRSLFEEGKSFV